MSQERTEPDAEEASSMSANEPDVTSSMPPELRELETNRGQADTYTATDSDQEDEPPGTDEA